MSARQMRALRRRMAMVFQDPYASLEPRFTIGQTIAEPLDVHRLHEGKPARRDRVGEMLEHVGLDPRWKGRRPKELSRGQGQSGWKHGNGARRRKMGEKGTNAGGAGTLIKKTIRKE